MADDPTEGLTPEQKARRKEAIDLANRELELAQLRREELEREGATRRELAEAKAAEAKADEAVARAIGLRAEELRAFTKDTEKYTAAAKLLAEQEAELIKQNKDFESALKNNIKAFTGVTDASDTLIGSLFKLKSEGKSNTEIFEEAKGTFKETFSALNVGTSIVRKVAESSLLLSAEMEKQTAAFNAQTGAGDLFNEQLRQGEQANRELGISLGEIAEARMGLMDGLSGYGLMQEEEQMRLTELSAQYGKLGVSTADFTGILETSTRMLGMSTTQTEAAIEDTRLLAQGLGISLPKALNDLNAALPKLVNFGDEAIEIFQELEKQSQATGLSVDELIGIADGFMTFDDAARAAGNLNAVLGTQMFDTMSLLEAQLQGPDAFINTLRDQLQGAGADFESLNVFQKDAIANAAGLNRQQLASIMNSSDGVTELTELQTDFNDALASGRSLFDELAILGKQVMISLAGPMEAIGEVLSVVNFLLEKVPDIIKSSVALVGGTMLAIGQAKRLLGIVPGSTRLRPIYAEIVGGFGGGGGGGGGGKGGKGAKGGGFRKGATTLLGGSLVAGSMLDEGQGFSAGGFAAGAAGGALLGAQFGGPYGAVIGGILGGIGSFFAEGTDDYPGGPLLNVAGEAGKELIVPPEHSAIVNNENTEALSEMFGKGVGGGGNQAVVAAINNLSKKMDALIQRLGAPGDFVLTVNKREFGRLTNEHFGAPGSSPVSGVG
ncbi:MAG: hypothetical protein ACXABD_14000 [Candidatus Thorarchaeota archaeon]|jgi:hypothetical protein